MLDTIRRYTHWLHTRWPAGSAEKLPEVREDGSTNVPGVFVVGDLTGVPLLKFASDTGARVVRRIAAELGKTQSTADDDRVDLCIIGGGVSGFAAALEANQQGLSFELLEAAAPFSTIVNFPKGKPIFTYPTDMTPTGGLQVTAEVKEDLVTELQQQVRQQGIVPTAARADRIERDGDGHRVLLGDGQSIRARRVVIAIGRSGNFRKLGVPGEQLDKVYNRLHDPKDYAGQDVLVVGGGDSALETAIAIAQCGGRVTLSYRKPEFSRPKPGNLEALERLAANPTADVEITEPSSDRVTTSTGAFLDHHRQAGRIDLALDTTVERIEDGSARLVDNSTKAPRELANDVVFSMIGREPPLDFFRRSGIHIRGETVGWQWAAVALFFLVVFAIYDWKNDGFIASSIESLSASTSFPNNVPNLVAGLGDWWSAQVEDRSSLIGVVAVSAKGRSFWYTLLYTLLIGVFGWRRIRRRKTRYVTVQTLTLFSVQLIPLFLLPELILPWLGYQGAWDSGLGASVANEFFPLYSGLTDAPTTAPGWGHPRAYWHAYGLILAWPLSVYNVFTPQPMVGWLVVSCIQTFVIIPFLVWRWGKGAYCGWICSCGGLAETLGDTHRHKMPHGAKWNRLNMLGQAILLIAFVLLAVRIWGWVSPESIANRGFALLLEGKDASGATVNPVSWKWFVDVLLGGILGVGLYIKYSGRVWCRFACPLAALMHIYARFSRFRIFPEKKKCISCNVCTSVCHMGIDVMNFANKGLPMADPECVRCSACVQSCPTEVLTFGELTQAAIDSTTSARA